MTNTFASRSQFGTHLDAGRRFGEEDEFGIRFNGSYRNGNTELANQSQELGTAALGLDYRGERVRLSADVGYEKNDVSLVQNNRLEPSRYAEDWKYDEREESVWGRPINIRRHLLGVVRQADVDAILGPPRHRVFPIGYSDWSDRKRQLFWKEERRLAREIVREGRAKVRKIIVRQRKRALVTELR